MSHTDVHKRHKMVQDYFTKELTKQYHPTMVIFDEPLFEITHRLNQEFLWDKAKKNSFVGLWEK